MKPKKEENDFRLPHPELDRRPWLSIIGLILGVAAWIVTALPLRFPSLETVVYILMGVAALAIVLCVIDMKRGPGLALVGIVVAATLILLLVTSLIGLAN